MKNLFKKFIGMLAAITALKWVDRDNGQLDRPGQAEGVVFPCALIKIQIPNRENITETLQRCELRLTVRIAHDLVKMETSSKAPSAAVDRSLAFYDLRDQVYKALQGAGDMEIEDLECVSEGDEDRIDGLSVYKMVFRCFFEDDTARSE